MARLVAIIVAVGFCASALYLLVAGSGGPFTNTSVEREFPAVVEPAPGVAEPPAARPAARIVSKPVLECDTEEILTLEVVREDGRPIAGAEVATSLDGVPCRATTDASGRARVPACRDLEAAVSVSRSDFMTETQTFALDPGTRRFVVPTRSSLVGRVAVGRGPPAEPMVIGLERPGPVVFPRLLARTDGEGRIEFFNLASNWSGELVLPKGYRREVVWRDPGSKFTRGRCIRPEVSEPLPPVGAKPEQPDGMVMVNNVLLSSSSARPLSSRLPRPDDEFAVYDVGYINLIPQSEVHVRVVDAEGQGIAGAAVWVGGSFACVVGGSPEGSAVQVDEEVLPSVSASSTQVQLRGRACPVEEVAKTTSQTGSPAFVVRVTIPAGER